MFNTLLSIEGKLISILFLNSIEDLNSILAFEAFSTTPAATELHHYNYK